MRFLLDTHTLLWFLRTPEVLPPAVYGILAESDEELGLSLATPWEMAIKTGRGKLDVREILDEFEEVAAQCRCQVLPVTVRHAIESGLLPPHHRDPFDRLMAAQALDLNLTLLSCDTIFDAYGVRRLWA